jgi:membrane protein
MLVTWGYSYYMEYFNSYESFYGGISSLLFLMLYIQIISYIFVLGMNINYAREKMIEENGKTH